MCCTQQFMSQKQASVAHDSPPDAQADDGDDLIPGLPDCVVLQGVLPRLPWYARAVLSATSKSWRRCTLQQPRASRDVSRQAFRDSPRKAVVVLHQLSDSEAMDCFRKMNTTRCLQRPYALSIFEGCDPTAPLLNMRPTDGISMRRVPPIPTFAPLGILHECGIASVDGRIFVIGGWNPFTNVVSADMYMLDIAAGLWMWEPMPPMNFPRAFFHCISDARKIYVLGGDSATDLHQPKPNPEVYDVDAQTWELLPRAVVSPTVHYNGASFIKGTDLVLTHGFYTTERGEPVRFKRAYNPVIRAWCDYESEDETDDAESDDNDGLKSGMDNKGVDQEVRRDAIKHGNVATGSNTISMARLQMRVITRVMMK